MTEDDAKAWVETHFGAPAVDRLAKLVDRILNENARQNLIARSSADAIWSRHIVDSAQLLPFAPASGRWLDVGTGGGFPGLVVAALRDEEIWFAEPRRKRAEFLVAVADEFSLSNVRVEQARVEMLPPERLRNVAVVSARAVASITTLLAATRKLTTNATLFVFPRGRSGRDELMQAERDWHGMFHVKQSATDPDSTIILAQGVRPK